MRLGLLNRWVKACIRALAEQVETVPKRGFHSKVPLSKEVDKPIKDPLQELAQAVVGGEEQQLDIEC